MPLLQITARDGQSVGCGRQPLDQLLERSIASLPAGAPIMVLVHGFKFSPTACHANPHRHILSLGPPRERGVISWPSHLGFGHGYPQEGLCISFGWPARGSLWKAYRQAAIAGQALATLIERIARQTDRPVHLLTHSLGARVALQGIAHARRGRVGRVFLMAGAEFAASAARCLDSPLGKRAEFINVISRENDLFDLMMETLIQPLSHTGNALGSGLDWAPDHWLDLQIDHDETRLALRRLGHHIPPANRTICHWSTYRRPGLLALYAALIRRGDGFPLAQLRAQLPHPLDPRWTRLRPVKRSFSALHFGRKATS